LQLFFIKVDDSLLTSKFHVTPENEICNKKINKFGTIIVVTFKKDLNGSRTENGSTESEICKKRKTRDIEIEAVQRKDSSKKCQLNGGWFLLICQPFLMERSSNFGLAADYLQECS